MELSGKPLSLEEIAAVALGRESVRALSYFGCTQGR
jgi:hypothetical protein